MAGAVVSSLSTLQTHLLGSHFNDGYVLGQIIVNIIFGVAVVGLFALAERSKRIFEINRLSSQGIDLGMGALVWYVLLWVTLEIGGKTTSTRPCRLGRILSSLSIWRPSFRGS